MIARHSLYAALLSLVTPERDTAERDTALGVVSVWLTVRAAGARRAAADRGGDA
jgi:hypothetical protein